LENEESRFLRKYCTKADFDNCKLHGVTFDFTDLTEKDCSTGYHCNIDPEQNSNKKSKIFKRRINRTSDEI
jgi:hypothetical protein